jgi:putative transposase
MDVRRKNIRLPHADYLGRQWYFLTACTQDRLPCLQDGALVIEHLDLLTLESNKQCFDIQAYCFMPDHLHLLVSGMEEASDCLAFIYGFKQRSAYAFKQTAGVRLWQHRAYDHVLRPKESWEAVAYYIWMNPVRKSLCARADDWPYSGSYTMDWKRLLAPPKELWYPPWKGGKRTALAGGT